MKKPASLVVRLGWLRRQGDAKAPVMMTGACFMYPPKGIDSFRVTLVS